MRILLDENLDWRLKYDLTSHDVETVSSLNWSGMRNGVLLRKAVENGFDAFITMDSNMVHQQNISGLTIAVIVLRARSNRLEDTRVLVPSILAKVAQAAQGDLTIIGE